MSAYIIVDVEVLDQKKYVEDYAKFVPAMVSAYGGRYLVRGSNIETLEGDWAPKRMAVVEFDTVEQAKAWYNSPEYVAVRGIRHASTNSKMIVVEGVPPA